MRIFVVVMMLWAASAGAEAPPSTCLVQPDKTNPVKPAAGRVLYCGLDLGSRSAKLSVVSMERGRNATVRDERLCKRTLGLGALVFDSRTGTARPLPADAIALLADTVREYQEICARDGGALVAAGATQWARDATNMAEVTSRVEAATGVRIDALTPRQEAEYSYAAASVHTPGRVVLDPGSNSFELSWEEKSSPEVGSVTVKYGYVRGFTGDFDGAPDYATGRARYRAHAGALLEEELAKRTPPTSLSGLKELVARGRVGRELVALGEDGAIVPLAVRGSLRSPSRAWVSDQKGYDAVLGGLPRQFDPSFGTMTTTPVRAAEVTEYVDRLGLADFKSLSSEPVLGLYGQKALVIPALVDFLAQALGVTRIVIVPQEVATGHILSRLAAGAGP